MSDEHFGSECNLHFGFIVGPVGSIILQFRDTERLLPNGIKIWAGAHNLLTVSLRDTDYQTQSEKINEDSLIYLRDTDYHYEDQYYYESCNDEKRLTTQSEKINEDWVM